MTAGTAGIILFDLPPYLRGVAVNIPFPGDMDITVHIVQRVGLLVHLLAHHGPLNRADDEGNHHTQNKAPDPQDTAGDPVVPIVDISLPGPGKKIVGVG